MKKAYTYARVSSDGQVEKYGLETQIEAMREYAKQNDMTIVQEFIEGGVSGERLNRPALNELRDNLSEIDTVLFFDDTRMSRDLSNKLILKQEFDKLGVELAFVKGGLVGNTPQDKLLFSMTGAIAEFELSNIRERTCRGRRQRIKNGLFMGGNGSKLYGYDYLEGKREINPETSQIVKQIFEWYLEGENMLSITARLHSLGVKSPSGNERWNKVAIYRILSNRSYTGKGEFWGIEISQPSLITLADFERVQTKLQRNKELSKRNAKNDYLLSGYIFCTHCGRRYIGSASHHTRYYNCPLGSQKVRIEPCIGKSLRADSLETIIWLEIEKALSNPELIMAGLEAINDADYAPELETLKTRMRHYQKEKQRAWRAFEITGDEATFRTQIKEIENEASQLSKRYSEIEGLVRASEQKPKPSDVNEACHTISQNMGQLTHEDRRKVLEALKIKVHTGEAIRIEGTLPIPAPSFELQLLRGG